MPVRHRPGYRADNIEKIRAQERITSATYRRNHPERARINVLMCKGRKRGLIRTVKERPCADCGVQYPYYVMDLDHARGDKILNMAVTVARGFSDEEILAEIAKCDVVCANCHRERTFQRRKK